MPEIGLFGSEGGVPITGIPTPIICAFPSPTLTGRFQDLKWEC